MNQLRLCTCVAASLAALGWAGAAAAATFTFSVVAVDTASSSDDALVGPIGSGVLDIDDDAIAAGDPLEPEDVSLEMILLGQTFTGADDVFGEPLVEFDDGAPSFLGMTVDENDRVNPVAIDEPGVTNVTLFSPFDVDDDGGLTIEALVNFGVGEPAPVPLPAGLPLAVAGLAALGLLTRRRAA